MSQQDFNKLVDYFDVPLLHMIAVFVTFTNVENTLKILSLLLAICYTIWKWRSEYKKKRK